VVDHAAPRCLQNVAGHLVVPDDNITDSADATPPDMDFSSRTPNPFRLGDAHLQGPDWGLFDYAGPCASVTGCCHLFRRADLVAPTNQGGGFSLALMRMLAAGGFAAYTGHVRVRHRKRSGIAGQGGGQEENAAGANAQGNRYKMQTMHPRAEIAQNIIAQAERLEAHLRSRLQHLDSAGDAS